MLADVVRRSGGGSAGPWADTFTRPNGNDLGKTEEGNTLWEKISGDSSINSNRLYFPSTGIAAFRLGGRSFDATLNINTLINSGLYFRIVDANNWWRARIERVSSSSSTTSYEWGQSYRHDNPFTGTCAGPHFDNTDSMPGGAVSLFGWGSFSSPPSFPTCGASRNHTHQNTGGGGYIHGHNYAKSGDPYKTGVTSTSSSTTHYYYIRLDRCVNGSVSQRASYYRGTTTSGLTAIRVRVVGNDIRVFANSTTTQRLQVTDSTHSSARLLGAGRVSGAGSFNSIEAELAA